MKPFDVYHLFDLEPASAKGSHLYDDKGNAYLDLYGGHAVISIGHSHPGYVRALTEQMHKIGFYSNSVQMPMQKLLAEKLGRLSGYENYSLFLCNSGAEANENALKLASFHNGRKKIIAMKGAFHGRTSLALAATDNPSIQAPANNNPNMHFIEMNHLESLDSIDADTCAVIIEGIQGVSGIHPPENDFLVALSKRCEAVGAILILDEVQSGYGRTGKFFAHQYAGIRPSLVTVAKGMGNGFPIGGVLIAPEFEAVKERLGTTFGGNYLACAAAISVLDVIEDERLMENSAKIGAYLMKELSNVPGIKAIRGNGLMLGIELDRPAAEVRNALLKKYGILTGSASQKQTIRLLPALNLSQQDADEFLNGFKSVMSSHE